MPEIDLETLSTPEYGYTVDDRDDDDPVLLDQDGNHIETWGERYPYDHRMSHEEYERLKRRLQIELLKLQNHAKRTGARHVIVFEGRDAAGKGGTIRSHRHRGAGCRACAHSSPLDRAHPTRRGGRLPRPRHTAGCGRSNRSQRSRRVSGRNSRDAQLHLDGAGRVTAESMTTSAADRA